MPYSGGFGRKSYPNPLIYIYSLGRKPFIVNDSGYGIIFQKCLSITCEELFKGWNRWMTGESTPPPLQYNSQESLSMRVHFTFGLL